VETDGQLNFLLRRRCDEAQGFYFGKAVPAAMVRDQARHIATQRSSTDLNRAIA
jgi:EAL domain-containing protein (putative c-di-GMP-specific phosphodiesterase class I)